MRDGAETGGAEDRKTGGTSYRAAASAARTSASFVTAPTYTEPSSVSRALTRRVVKTVPEPNFPVTLSPSASRKPWASAGTSPDSAEGRPLPPGALISAIEVQPSPMTLKPSS